jgi:hypothetical protein
LTYYVVTKLTPFGLGPAFQYMIYGFYDKAEHRNSLAPQVGAAGGLLFLSYILNEDVDVSENKQASFQIGAATPTGAAADGTALLDSRTRVFEAQIILSPAAMRVDRRVQYVAFGVIEALGALGGFWGIIMSIMAYTHGGEDNRDEEPDAGYIHKIFYNWEPNPNDKRVKKPGMSQETRA